MPAPCRRYQKERLRFSGALFLTRLSPVRIEPAPASLASWHAACESTVTLTLVSRRRGFTQFGSRVLFHDNPLRVLLFRRRPMLAGALWANAATAAAIAIDAATAAVLPI